MRKSLQSKPTDNLEAYDYYLQGSEHERIGFSSLDDREYKCAVQMYEKAIELDPKFTMAYVTPGLRQSQEYILVKSVLAPNKTHIRHRIFHLHSVYYHYS